MSTQPSPAEIVMAVVRQWLELEDDLLPVVPLAVAVANRFKGPPVWLMIVAPPSSGKSDVIMGISSLRGALAISSVTSKTFASGMIPRKDAKRPPSLLEWVQEDGKWLLTLKDFGTIQSLPPLQRNPIFGQLREIYDGKYDAYFGTSVDVAWSGKLALIVGATPAVDRLQKWSAELGERFVLFRPTAPSPKEVARKAREVAIKEKHKKDAIAGAYQRAFAQANKLLVQAGRFYPKNAGQVAEALSVFVANARRPVRRERGSASTYQVLAPEGPGRLVKIFVQLYAAAAVCYAGDQDAATRLVARVAVDSLPHRRGRLLPELTLRQHGVGVAGMSDLLDCDEETARRELEDLELIGLATSSKAVQATIYKASTKLEELASDVLPDAKQPLEKLFDLLNNSTSEREREEEGE